MIDLTVVVLAGLLGSAHCVGICGGFVLLLGGGSGRTVAARQGAYFAGKTLTYALFGAIAGGVGFALQDLFGGSGGVVSVGLGAAMVGLGLGLCRIAWGRASAPGARFAARLGPAIGRLVASNRPGTLVAPGAGSFRAGSSTGCSPSPRPQGAPPVGR